MANRLLSDNEREYIKRGVAENIRADGRSNKDYRRFKLITGGVSNTSGSAEIKLNQTNIIVGIKAEIDTPSRTSPNEGKIQFFVDCSALASPDFQGREGEDLGNLLAHRLSDIYTNSKCIDLSSLCIIPGQQCWVLYIDALVLEWSGGVLDCLSIAVKAALGNTRIPKLEVTGEGEELEIEVSDNPYDAEPIDVSNIPVIVTLSLVGNSFIVDADHEEETCGDCLLSVAVNSKGCMCGMIKDGNGSIPVDLYFTALQLCREVASDVIKTVDNIKMT